MGCHGIWIADDDDDDLLLYSEALTDLGVKDRPRFFRDSRILLNELNTKADSIYPCVVIIDGRMPGIGGMELVRILSDNGALNNQRVIIMTGNRSPADAQFSDAYGVEVYEKPVAFADLTELFKKILDSLN